MLEMKNVGKIYRTELLETHALRNFSLSVEAGEFVAVTGPSGSGKTTFLNVTGLLESFDAGSYFLDGQDVSQLVKHCVHAILDGDGVPFQFLEGIPRPLHRCLRPSLRGR